MGLSRKYSLQMSSGLKGRFCQPRPQAWDRCRKNLVALKGRFIVAGKMNFRLFRPKKIMATDLYDTNSTATALGMTPARWPSSSSLATAARPRGP